MDKHSRNMSRTVEIKGPRSTKIVKDTGLDNQHMAGKTDQLRNGGFKGGVHDASSSISGATTRKI